MILESVENGPLIWHTVEENGVTKTKNYAELSAAEKIQADCDMKATNIILQGLPAHIYSLVNHHRVSKDLWEKVQLLIQDTFLTKQERECKLLQNLVSQLDLLEEKLSQEDINQKLLRSLSPEWNTHVVVWRNKADLDTMSMDDLYNNLKVYEPELKGMSSSSSSTQNMAFVTQVNASYSTNIDNLSDAGICLFFASQPNSPQLVHAKLEQIHPDDLKEMDLRWQMAMVTTRARRFLKKTRKKLTVNGNETIGFDKSKMECYNYQKKGDFAKECIAPRNQDNKHKESSRRSVPMETSTTTIFVSCDGLGGYDWSDQAEEGPNYALMTF
nr:hypothetical protein [Tanacetum cinerariifolium]